MTTHELARLLLEGPDQLVVIEAHEPNEDTFDRVERVEPGVAYQVDSVGWGDDLFRDRTSWRDSGAPLPSRKVAVTVLR